MKITLEAEVAGQYEGMVTPSMNIPNTVKIILRVLLTGSEIREGKQEFTQQVILRRDEVQSVFDHLMRDLTRNMRETLVSYLEGRNYPEKFPLMPVLKFERMRG
jgi:hypothetical protein